MKQWTFALTALIFSCTALASHTAKTELGAQNDCYGKYKNYEYCYPIHGAIKNKNEFLGVKFSNSPTLFPLFPNTTIYTYASFAPKSNETVKVTLEKIINHHLTPLRVIYNGNYGYNKIGLVCNESTCTPWATHTS